MLSSLKIQNFALIQSLEIGFQAGLDIVTGETGAGKSIILGALGLILGARAESDSLMDPDKKCVIEGRFRVEGYGLESVFKENELDWESATILRREISPGGKSRAFVNDTPVNLNLLKEIGERLVDIHSQFQTQKLADARYQLSLLDAVAGHKNLLVQYADKYRLYRKMETDLQTMLAKEATGRKEYDYCVFQLKELDDANIQSQELEKLEEELALLSNAERIKQVLEFALYEISEEENSFNIRLAGMAKQLASIATFNSRLLLLHKRVDGVLVETKDIAEEIADLYESMNVDAERLEQVNNRLRVLNQLLTKHQLKTETELLNYADELRQKTVSTESASHQIEEMRTRLAAMKPELESTAKEISINRQNQVPNLTQQLESLLKQVGIPEARLDISLLALDALNEFGRDRIQLLFSANKGTKPMEVGNVASGGELSRLMLCFKYILADSIFLPTVVFDEIDSGVSGEVAIKVGQIIKKLSKGRQVLCITHLPQVAAMGDHQYVVYKDNTKERTVTSIRQIENSERIEEIAKMIGGYKPGAAAVESAKELLAYSYL